MVGMRAQPHAPPLVPNSAASASAGLMAIMSIDLAMLRQSRQFEHQPN